ncbi:hypothetical protein LSH36_516g01100 [Paralvinella palmiformis]|uniref:Phosphatidylcholine transfer protein n=1 Tax=Paralvinella palmiformis TaxID=53620 RepID=A0AAD9J7W1_9ANNE|nr:hypothetical protein LSH36_516g01100 [Paralvinella palmiformis]
MASRKMLLAINGLFSSAVRSVLPKSSVSAISPAACVSFGGTSRSLYLIKLKDCLVCISRQTNQPAMPSNSYKFLRSWRVPFGLASRRFTSRQFGYVNGVGSRVVRLNSMLSQLSGKVNDVIMVYLRQCHVIAALRIRRATQIIAWYSDLGYDLQTLRRLINQLATSVGRHFRSGKKEKSVFAIFSGVAAFNWDENKIQEEQLKETAEEIGLIRRTTSSSLMGVESDVMSGWEKVIDKDNLAAYRKPLPDSSYLYEYKVFGTFHDIPARAFYNAQLDIEFRKQWDRLVVKLEVVEKDEESGTEVVQWITHFPYPMYQREYIYVRRALVDAKKKIMVIVSRSTDHPCCPASDKYVRVSTYMSNMVIRPHGNSFDEVSCVPDFVQKMHNAAKLLHENRTGGTKCQKEYQQTNPM